MAGYFTKLDSGITESTIWQAPDTTRIVWITMMAMADQHGYVGASLPGLASRARVSMQACAEAVKAFLAPDEYSRTADFEGRRIAEADGGWILLNHAKYRAKISAEDKRERSRVAMAALRARRKAEANNDAALTPVTCGDPALTLLSQAEADNRSRKRKETPPKRSALPAGFEAFYKAYPRKVARDDAVKAFEKRKPDAEALDAMLKALERQKASDAWTKDGGKFIPHPSTWLNGARWMDEVESDQCGDSVFACAR